MKSLPAFGNQPLYQTDLGAAYVADSLDMLKQLPDGSVNLVVTSPPFALLRVKEYGNKDQHEYIDWLSEFGRLVHQKLTDDGSFVIDLGGAYQRGVPVRSLYNYRVLLKFVDELGFHLAEEFFWHNPSKLPSPIEWVNKRKIRVKDSVNTVWWFSKTEWPKSDVTKVLSEYSDRMKKLIKDPSAYYTPSKRPSGHDIGVGFGKDNGGAIPSNLLQISNGEATSKYLKICKELGLSAHPARFPSKLPEFFIKMLTTPGDLVIDIFAGSNTTGYVCELEGRRWLSFEQDHQYLSASVFRFLQNEPIDVIKSLYEELIGNAGAMGTSKKVVPKIQHNLAI
ncbi:site-specific DNA-methyltransferase [Methylovorus menthalis]|uniref:DNA-methyltransferase n=1 Tax=Methylovorus menthalis TaxID=1002227 RepID=UPI001E562362|nr:site-specific DNA-methyltransferase [Methylovorus menthalis]MCB4812435.1 site-specific DNA-methyltransferase [Methylovorus menthalis]